MQAFQGAQSLGTFDDLLLMLNYIGKVYGTKAMPRILVLGITPRFVANIPHNSSPLAMAINRYSPFYRVEQTKDGSRLVSKNSWEGLLSRARFLFKQQPRYLAALSSLLSSFLDDNLPYESFIPEFPKMRAFRRAVSLQAFDDFLPALNYVRDIGLGANLGRWLRLYTSPYKYHHLVPLGPEVLQKWLHDPESFWFKGHAWNPAADAPMIHRQFRQLLELSTEWGMDTYVVNLPEHEWNRDGYQPGYYENYLKLVQMSLDNTPFLNLRDMLEPQSFYDVGHPTLPGAIRETDRVIEFIELNRQKVRQCRHVN